MKTAQMMLVIALMMILAVVPSYAQKGLYIGAGLGSAANDGDIGEDYEAGGGIHYLLGFKATEKLGFELEFGGYEQKMKEESALFSKAAWGGFMLNTKYFLGEAEPRTFRPYISGGIGISAFAWEYTGAGELAFGHSKDALGALSLAPGIGAEVMLGRIAALNLNGRYFLNGWGEETSEGVKLEGDNAISGNTVVINLGLILHL